MRTLIVTAILCAISPTALAQDVAYESGNEKTWPALIQDRQVSVSEDDSELVSALKKRRNASLDELRDRFTFWAQGSGTLESVCDNLDRFIDSNRDIGAYAAGDLQLQKDKLAFAESALRQANKKQSSENTHTNLMDVYFARYYVLNEKVKLIQMAEQPKAK